MLTFFTTTSLIHLYMLTIFFLARRRCSMNFQICKTFFLILWVFYSRINAHLSTKHAIKSKKWPLSYYGEKLHGENSIIPNLTKKPVVKEKTPTKHHSCIKKKTELLVWRRRYTVFLRHVTSCNIQQIKSLFSDRLINFGGVRTWITFHSIKLYIQIRESN